MIVLLWPTLASSSFGFSRNIDGSLCFPVAVASSMVIPPRSVRRIVRPGGWSSLEVSQSVGVRNIPTSTWETFAPERKLMGFGRKVSRCSLTCDVACSFVMPPSGLCGCNSAFCISFCIKFSYELFQILNFCLWSDGGLHDMDMRLPHDRQSHPE